MIEARAIRSTVGRAVGRQGRCKGQVLVKAQQGTPPAKFLLVPRAHLRAVPIVDLESPAGEVVAAVALSAVLDTPVLVRGILNGLQALVDTEALARAERHVVAGDRGPDQRAILAAGTTDLGVATQEAAGAVGRLRRVDRRR